MVERGVDSTLLRVSVRANPPANVTWKINGREISRFDGHFTFQLDGSLQLHKVDPFRDPILQRIFSVKFNSTLEFDRSEKPQLVT